MPKPRECTPVTLHVSGNLDLCVVLFPLTSAPSGHLMGRPPCSVHENIATEAILCITSIKTNSIFKPTSMISGSVDSPRHVSNLSRRVARLDGARLHHLLSCLPRDSIVVVSGADIPTRWPRLVTWVWWMGLSVAFATPVALASTVAH
jgi:hypothetical protein